MCCCMWSIPTTRIEASRASRWRLRWSSHDSPCCSEVCVGLRFDWSLLRCRPVRIWRSIHAFLLSLQLGGSHVHFFEVVLESIRLDGEITLQTSSVVKHLAYTTIVILSERLELFSMLEVDLRLALCDTIIVSRDKLLFSALQSVRLLLG